MTCDVRDELTVRVVGVGDEVVRVQRLPEGFGRLGQHVGLLRGGAAGARGGPVLPPGGARHPRAGVRLLRPGVVSLWGTGGETMRAVQRRHALGG